MEKRTFKEGDKVKIKSHEWYSSMEKDIYSGSIKLKGNDFVSDMVKYLGREATITGIFYHNGYPNYILDIDTESWGWTDEMLEGVLLSSSEKYFEVYQFGDLYVKVNTKDKTIFPEFYNTPEEALLN